MDLKKRAAGGEGGAAGLTEGSRRRRQCSRFDIGQPEAKAVQQGKAQQ